MTGGQGGSQQPKRTFALRSNVHAPTGAVATVARCRADKGAPLSRAMVAAVDQQLTCHNRRNRSFLVSVFMNDVCHLCEGTFLMRKSEQGYSSIAFSWDSKVAKVVGSGHNFPFCAAGQISKRHVVSLFQI